MAVPDRDDVRREVEIIRGIVDNFDCPQDADLKRMHQAHCGFSEDVNTELDACEALIDANDEALAVQRAERSQLLELVATLESFDSEGWNEFLDDHGLKHPPELRLSTAERLNQCFGPVRQREPLMRELRWHALSGSPLRVRLGVMYRIRTTDQNPAAWEDDIRDFEEARVAEIDQELEDAISRQDAARLGVLCRELTADTWVKQLDRKLIKQAKQEFQKCAARQARTRIPKILEELRNAESGGESQIAEGRRLMQQLEVQLTRARFPKDAEEFELAREAVEWIVEANDGEQNDADYAFMADELEHLLNQFVGMKKRSERQDARDQLKQIEYRFRSSDEGVPENSVNRLQSVYDAVEREERRAQAFRLTAVACATVTVGVLLYLGLQYRNHVNLMAGHEERLGQLVELEDFSATESYIEKLQDKNPEILEHPPIAALITQHRQKESTEQERVILLMSGLKSLDDEIAEVDTLPTVKALSNRINDLESSCRFEKELDDVESRRRKLTVKQVAIQERIDKQFDTDLKLVNDRYEQVDSNDVAALKAIRDEYRVLEKRSEVSSNLTTAISGFQPRIMARVALLLDEQKQTLSLAGITRTVGSWPAFQAALEKFSKEFAASARGLQMQRVLAEEAIVWAEIEAQNSFNGEWSELNFTKVPPSEARTLVESGQKFLADHPGYEDKQPLQELLSYLETVSARDDDNGDEIIDPFLEVLQDPQVAGLLMLLTKAGGRVYTDEQPKDIGNGVIQIKQFDDSTLTTKTTKTYFPEKLAPQPRVGTRVDWEAPQSKFALQARSSLTRMDDSEWEVAMLELLDKLADNERMDPIIRFQLLDNILPIALEGSALLQGTLQGTAEKISSIRLGTNLNPFDPDDLDTIKARREAERFLNKLPDIGEMLRDIAKSRATVTSPIFAEPRQWVAWVYKDSGTKAWMCAAPKPPAADFKGDLFVAIKDDNSPRFVKIGVAKNGNFTITDSGTLSALVEGRPVFSRLSK